MHFQKVLERANFPPPPDFLPHTSNTFEVKYIHTETSAKNQEALQIRTLIPPRGWLNALTG